MTSELSFFYQGDNDNFQHTGHIGIDGIHFGNVAGFFDFKSPTSSYASMPCLAGAAPAMSLGPTGDSELAPLLNSGKGHGTSTPSKKSNTFDGHQKLSKNPRLGNRRNYCCLSLGAMVVA